MAKRRSRLAKATSGPWYADDSGNVYGASGRLVANCGGFTSSVSDGGRAENMANTALVVEVLPTVQQRDELLAASKALLSMVESEWNGGDHCLICNGQLFGGPHAVTCPIEMSRRAISKAE